MEFVLISIHMSYFMKNATVLFSLVLLSLVAGCNNNSESLADKEAQKMDAYKTGILAKQAAARASANKAPDQQK